MARLRTLRRLVPILVGLFLIAQFAGVVPRSAVAKPDIKTAAAQMHHQQAQDQSGHSHSNCNESAQHNPDGQHGIADQCCALHLLTAVILPLAQATIASRLAQALLHESSAPVAGIGGHPLDRPPRSPQSL
jgi:hypothetical protein